MTLRHLFVLVLTGSLVLPGCQRSGVAPSVPEGATLNHPSYGVCVPGSGGEAVALATLRALEANVQVETLTVGGWEALTASGHDGEVLMVEGGHAPPAASIDATDRMIDGAPMVCAQPMTVTTLLPERSAID